MSGSTKDVIGLGDAMVSFSPPGLLRLEQAGQLEVWPTGAEANAAVALARLGKRVGWISKLPDHTLSRLIVGAVSRHGVDTSRVVWTPEGRVGTLFYERGVPPRPPRVWYDRKDSAFTTLTASELDWTYLTGTTVVLMAGTAPALSPMLRETTRHIAERVRAAGRLFALDVNYRAKLWSPKEATDYLVTLLPLVSILFSGVRDAARLFGLSGEPEDVGRALQERFRIPTVVLTLGSKGAVAVSDRATGSGRGPRGCRGRVRRGISLRLSGGRRATRAGDWRRGGSASLYHRGRLRLCDAGRGGRVPCLGRRRDPTVTEGETPCSMSIWVQQVFRCRGSAWA